MDHSGLKRDIREVLEACDVACAEVLQISTVSGGCISDAYGVEVRGVDDSTRRYFVKRNDSSMEDNFRCEAVGLERLGAANAIRVPKPLGVVARANSVWLVTEWIETRRPGQDFFPTFGRELAGLHRATRGDALGLDHDNYLGASRQINGSRGSWIEFVAEQRLAVQLRLGVDAGRADSALRRGVEGTIERLPDLLAGREPSTSLIHGDLWSGNYLCDDLGRPVVVDPAIYYGCREAEWGMIALFGGCPRSFEQAYQAEYAMPDGWQRRIRVYVLYHLLNHLNLFGGSYAAQCQSVAGELLRSLD